MLKKVMCIDDDMITLTLCKMVIGKAVFGQEIITSTNGKEGLMWFSDFFKSRKISNDIEAPKIIFLDLNMPIMNGWDFLEDFIMKYHDRIPETKVVILSSTVNPEDFLRANRYEIVIDFINKPLTTDGLDELKKNEHIKKYFN